MIGRHNRKGGTASLHSHTCVKRNAVFGARFKGLSLYFLYNVIRIKTGLDTYPIRIQTRTPVSRYPPYDHSKCRRQQGKSTKIDEKWPRRSRAEGGANQDQNYPKHLWGQTLQGKIGRLFPPKENFPLENTPQAQNQYMQEKILGELIFFANTRGACIRTRANTENICEESFSAY